VNNTPEATLMIKPRRAFSRVALSLLILLPLAACTSSTPYHQGEQSMKTENFDQAVLSFSKALAQKPGDIKYQVALARARLRASEDHFEKGQHYAAAGQTEAAIAEMQQAVLLDPSNQYAGNELAKLMVEYKKKKGEEPSEIEKMKEKAKMAGRVTPRLNPKSNIPIALKFKDETIRKVYDALSKATGITFLYDERVDLGKKISVELSDITFSKALDVLMAQNKHFFKVWDENTILIADDNQQKHKEYDDLVIQTFYLSNADVKDVQVLLRTLLDARQLAQNDRLNAITIRDTPERVQVAEKIIESNDKAKAELIVDVQLLELNRDLLQNLGIDLVGASGASGKSLTIGYTAGTTVPLNNLGLLQELGNYAIGPIPSVVLNFLRSDADAKVLAKPQLRVSEGEKASVKIGDRIPIPTTTFNTVTTGTAVVAPITSFNYQNVGINIDVEPRVHHNKEITLKLKVELSNVSGSVSSGGGVTQPIIGTREIETQIRLKDGETNLLAGLIRDEERSTLSSVPGLGQIPVLKHLFGSTETERKETDIVLTLTPHIIRVPDINQADLEPLWIGTDQDVGLRGSSKTSPFGAPFESDGTEEQQQTPPVGPGVDTEGANPGNPPPAAGGAAAIATTAALAQGANPAPPPAQGNPAQPASPATNTVSGGGGAPAPANPPAAAPQIMIMFSPPNVLATVGDNFAIQVLISQASRVGSVPFHIAYDPKVVQFASGAEGVFLKQDGATTIFNAQASSMNEVFVALARVGVPTGASGGGVLCTFQFQAIAPGVTTLAFTDASVLDPQGQVLNFLFAAPVQVNVQAKP
jgi:general secretion pathway protein D